MSKITRKNQKLFGSSAGAAEIAKFGSLAAGTPVRYSGVTADPDNIQALPNYLEGWFGAVLGQNSPAIEDMNALCYLFARQLAYIFQAGVAEWDSTTTYYIGSIVSSSGALYTSVTDNNLNNAVTDTVNWDPAFQGDLSAGSQAVSTGTVLTSASNGKAVECNTSAGSFTLTLPASPQSGFKVHVKDVAGSFQSFPLTINPNGKTLEGLTSNYIVYAPYWDRVIFYDGTSYYLM